MIPYPSEETGLQLKETDMQSRDFCYWLQGYIEVTLAQGNTQDLTISPQQAKVIQNHLALVFKHEIDPSMGDQQHQDMLNGIHSPGKHGPAVFRC